MIKIIIFGVSLPQIPGLLIILIPLKFPKQLVIVAFELEG
jgi:hypothetical protein